MKYKYEVAISFAGEDRQFAEAVANGLRNAGITVFMMIFMQKHCVVRISL